MPSWQRWLDKPQSGLVCLASWILSSAIFIGMVGPLRRAHAERRVGIYLCDLGSCARQIRLRVPSRRPGPASKFFLFYQPHPAVPPLWPLISGAYGAVTRIGHTVPFPSQHALGRWLRQRVLRDVSTGRRIPPPSSRRSALGYLSWFVLLAGVIALLRASGRGRTGWEVFGVIFIALGADRVGAGAVRIPSAGPCCLGAGAGRHGVCSQARVGVGGGARRAGGHLAAVRAVGPCAALLVVAPGRQTMETANRRQRAVARSFRSRSSS